MLDLKDLSKIYTDPFEKFPLDSESKILAANIYEKLKEVDDWSEEVLEKLLRDMSRDENISFGKIAQLIRNMLTGKKVTPGIFDMLVAFGKDESLNRLYF